MIVFDLACDAAHVFEAWFASSEEYLRQNAAGLVVCPICGSGTVDKAVMAPRVAAKGNRGPTPAAAKAMMQTLAKMQAAAIAKSDYVGSGFADEARSIHLGDATPRSIYGEASPQDAKALLDEGIAVAPLIFPVVPPEKTN